MLSTTVHFPKHGGVESIPEVQSGRSPAHHRSLECQAADRVFGLWEEAAVHGEGRSREEKLQLNPQPSRYASQFSFIYIVSAAIKILSQLPQSVTPQQATPF